MADQSRFPGSARRARAGRVRVLVPMVSVTLGGLLLAGVFVAGSWSKDGAEAVPGGAAQASVMPLPGGTPALEYSARQPDGAQGGTGGGGVPAGLSDSDEGSVTAALLEAAKEAPERNGRFQLPLVRWSMVTDCYGAPRGGGMVHGGIDLALDGLTRSPVYAACEGTVQVPEANKVYGAFAIVDCGEGWTTMHAHLSQVIVGNGQRASFETVVGFSGTTGFSTAEHLHFEIRYNGAPVNPERYLDFRIAPGAPLTYDTTWLETPTPTPSPTPTPDFAVVPSWLVPTPTPTKTPVPTPTTPATAVPTPTPTPIPLHTLITPQAGN